MKETININFFVSVQKTNKKTVRYLTFFASKPLLSLVPLICNTNLKLNSFVKKAVKYAVV